jgi:adenine-specific DNA-methyltransferase
MRGSLARVREKDEIATAPELSLGQARERGVYYTPRVAARFMAEWIAETGPRLVLEPSMGDGIFVEEIRRASPEQQVIGVELSAEALERVIAQGVLSPDAGRCGDFLELKPFPVDAVIGNPPYVRIRNLPATEAARALERSERVLGESMEASGSVWMPFVLHSMSFLSEGGRLAMVLPYDLTYVRYARPLWRALGASFGSLRVIRVRQRLFPEILQETVLLLADGFGSNTSEVHFDAYEDVAGLVSDLPEVSRTLSLQDIEDGKRVFLEALLSDEARVLLTRLDSDKSSTIAVGDVAAIHIGYVAGDKNFFHPNAKTVEDYGLPLESLLPTLTTSRTLAGRGLFTGEVESERLFWPGKDGLERLPGVQRYLQDGQASGVADRYKCRVRDPWYLVPGLRIPDVLFPVFSDQPLVMVNDSGALASNSLLCGYLRDGYDSLGFARSWFTSLTRLQVELQVHSLGGGVLVLVPREVAAIKMPRLRRDVRHAERLDRALLSGDINRCFALGDSECLERDLGLVPNEVDLIQQAVSDLAGWRRGAAGVSGGPNTASLAA